MKRSGSEGGGGGGGGRGGDEKEGEGGEGGEGRKRSGGERRNEGRAVKEKNSTASA